MRILVVGATGQVGAIVAGALGERHEVIGLSRSSDPRLDLLDADSISAALTRIGRVDAVVDCAGGAPFLPLRQLTSELVLAGVRTKMLGKVDLLLHGHPWVADGGSFTFTTGITARRVVPGGSVAALANGAIESFVRTAATEMPRGIRVNAVSPTVVEGSDALAHGFRGFDPVAASVLAAAFVAAVEGSANGRVIEV